MDYSLKLIVNISKNMRVLYVEDNKEAQEQTFKMLKNFFTDITLANNGQEGLDKFKRELYQIIFTDIEMPVMNGITMIEKIREIDKNIPIVIFSAYDKSEYFLKTISEGIDGYILKPYDLKQFIKVITKIITKFDIKIKFKNKIKLVDDFYWDKENEELTKENQPIKLTKNEIKLFKLLSSSKQRIASNEDIEYYIFNDDIIDNKRVRNLIYRLKIKLQSNLIESNYANGYKLKIEETI